MDIITEQILPVLSIDKTVKQKRCQKKNLNELSKAHQKAKYKNNPEYYKLKNTAYRLKKKKEQELMNNISEISI